MNEPRLGVATIDGRDLPYFVALSFEGEGFLFVASTSEKTGIAV